MQLYPLMIQTIAIEKPVFPEVVSTTVEPGFNKPFFSAASIICIAILSLVEWPGLKDSNLAYTVAGISLVTSFSLTKGVLPIRPRMLS